MTYPPPTPTPTLLIKWQSWDSNPVLQAQGSCFSATEASPASKNTGNP